MDIYGAQRLVGEDAIQMIYERFQILENIKMNQPVGRRKLTGLLKLPERKIRAHLEYLSRKNIVCIDKRGVLLNSEIEDVTPFLLDYFTKLNLGFEKERKLEKLLGIKKVLVAPGNADTDSAGLTNIGMKAESYFADKLDKGGYIAVSGGSTLKAFSDNLRSVSKPNYSIVPVRGALGASHSYQANTIALFIGMKLGCGVLQLNIPDNIDEELLNSLKKHPDILAVTSLYKKIDILLFGIGRAETLANIRSLSDEDKRDIIENGCVTEAVGYYFSSDGKIVKQASGIGMDIRDLNRIPEKIALAGGAGKKDAIKALCRYMKDITLVTDEGCADALLNN